MEELLNLTPPVAVYLCSRWWERYGRVSFFRRPKTCYPYFQFRDRLGTWPGKYPRKQWV